MVHNMNSILYLSKCAQSHLDNFISVNSNRSFHTYDRRGVPGVLDPLDVLAPALLDAPIRRDQVNQMFSSDASNPYSILRLKMESCLREIHIAKKIRNGPYDFGEIDFSEPEETEYTKARELWELVRACYIASNETPDIKATKVSKILHRKEPEFIPIIDSKLVSFYGLPMSSPGRYWQALQEDFVRNREFLDCLSKGVHASDGNQISSLRVADIVIWEHVVTGCTTSGR